MVSSPKKRAFVPHPLQIYSFHVIFPEAGWIPRGPGSGPVRPSTTFASALWSSPRALGLSWDFLVTFLSLEIGEITTIYR